MHPLRHIGGTIQFPAWVPINPPCSDSAGVRVQVLRDQYCPHRECWVMEWEIQVKLNDLGATSSTNSDSSHTIDLMFDLRPQAAAIMVIKSPSGNKESCKSNTALSHAHMLAVIQLHLNKSMSRSVFQAVIQNKNISVVNRCFK